MWIKKERTMGDIAMRKRVYGDIRRVTEVFSLNWNIHTPIFTAAYG
jgi:prophage DNA circulation protein